MNNFFKTRQCHYLKILKFGLATVGFSAAVNAHAAPAAVYENRNDHYRTGANLNETILNTSNVVGNNFGLLFTMPVDSPIHTQPLYAPNVSIGGIKHNVIYIVTASANVYAFDADHSGPALWMARLGLHTGFTGYNWGVNSTPIIDPNTGSLYVVARGSNNILNVFKLHALDIASGAEKFGGPVNVSGSYTFNGANFETLNQQLVQHTGLALANGNVIFGFAGVDEGPGLNYNGWVLSYNAQTLQQNGVFLTTRKSPAIGGGVWQSGRAPAVDDEGNVYFHVGNAYQLNNFGLSTNGYDGVNNFSESILKTDHNLNLLDWFTPIQWQKLDENDTDTASSGPLLVPEANLLVGGGKDGNLYVLNTNNMGRLSANNGKMVQNLPTPNTKTAAIFTGPVFWQRSAAQGGSLLFNVYAPGPIYAFKFSGGSFYPAPVSVTPAGENSRSGYEISYSLSANQDASGTGILWALISNPSVNKSVLRAYNAENLSQELWNSAQYSSDSLTAASTYIPPTIVNGKVYAPTNAHQLTVYGLKP